MLFQYSASPKQLKEKDWSFSNAKDLPFTLYCLENHACVVTRSGREHLQMQAGKN